MTQPSEQPEPLSQRAYASALRMHQADNRLRKPALEDFLHLDRTPSPLPRREERPPADPAVVSATVARMQAASLVTFAAPPDDAA